MTCEPNIGSVGALSVAHDQSEVGLLTQNVSSTESVPTIPSFFAQGVFEICLLYRVCRAV